MLHSFATRLSPFMAAYTLRTGAALGAVAKSSRKAAVRPSPRQGSLEYRWPFSTARPEGERLQCHRRDPPVAEIEGGVAEMYRPDAGPGLALNASQRASGIVTAGASLKLDRVLATSVITDGDVRYLVGSLYDVRKGSLLREGRLRLAGWRPPEGGLPAMATFLLKGEPSGLVLTAPDHKKANLNVKPATALGPPSAKVVDQGPKRAPGSAKKWTALGTGALAVGLAGFGLYENSQANKNFSKARAMLDESGNPGPTWDEDLYNKYRSDGNRQRKMATATFVGAGVALGTAAVFGYLGYKQSGAFGSIEF